MTGEPLLAEAAVVVPLDTGADITALIDETRRITAVGNPV
jgi:hypothetical protein